MITNRRQHVQRTPHPPRPRVPGSLRQIAEQVGRSHTAVAKALRAGRCWQEDGRWVMVDGKPGPRGKGTR